MQKKLTPPRLLVPFVFIFPSLIQLIYALTYPAQENYAPLLVLAMGICMFLQFTPWSFQYFFNQKGTGTLNTWYTSSAFFLLLGFIPLVIIPGKIIAIIGWSLFVFALIQMRSLALLLFFAVYSIVLLPITSSHYSTFELLFKNGLHDDALFHSAIANMINTYGTASTGLDGTPFMHYHIGSHWFFAQMAKLCDVSLYVSYQILWGFVLVPQIFSAMFYFILDYKQFKYKSINQWLILEDWKFWLLFSVIFYGVYYFSMIKGMPFVTANFGSESWGMSIGLSMILLSLTTIFLNTYTSHPTQLNKPTNWIFCCFMFPLLLSATGFLKISVILILFCMISYCYLRLALYKRLIFNMAILLSTIAFVLTMLCVMPEKNGTRPPIMPLFQWLNWGTREFRSFFPLIYCIWAWIYSYASLRLNGVQTWQDLKINFVNKRLFDVEFLVVLCAVCLLPGNLIIIDGGSYIYFSDYQLAVSACLLLGLMPMRTLKDKLAPVPISSLFICLIIAPLIVSETLQSERKLLQFKQDIQASLREKKNLSTPVATAEKLHIMAGVSLTNNALFNLDNYSVFKRVDQLNQLSLSEKRQTLVFVKPNAELTKLTMTNHCKFAPFVIPALTGLALIEGLPSLDCLNTLIPEDKDTITRTYLSGYPKDTYTISTDTLSRLTPNELCKKVINKGFSQLVVFDMYDGENPIRKYTCR